MSVEEECSEDGCAEPAKVLGLCKPHYGKDYYAKNREKALAAAAAYRAKPEVQESLRLYRSDPENKERRRSWLVDPAHPDRIIRIQMRKYKMEPEDYEGILADQSDGCAICGSVIPGGNGRFHVDHDHDHCPGEKICGGCVRGLLCANCNLMLGHAKDDPDVLRAAADYLDRYQLTLEESA